MSREKIFGKLANRKPSKKHQSEKCDSFLFVRFCMFDSFFFSFFNLIFYFTISFFLSCRFYGLFCAFLIFFSQIDSFLIRLHFPSESIFLSFSLCISFLFAYIFFYFTLMFDISFVHLLKIVNIFVVQSLSLSIYIYIYMHALVTVDENRLGNSISNLGQTINISQRTNTLG